MNEQNNIGKASVDQRIQDLLNSSVDGEISASEQNELNALLENSEDVRNLNEELRAITSLLDELPELEPPQYLQSAIERQVRLPVQGDTQEKKRLFPGSWLNANWLRTGFALAAGVVLTVGVYEMGSEPIPARDAGSMAGTMANSGPSDQQGTLLDVIRLETEHINGQVELRNKDDFFTLNLQLSSDGPSEVVINFAGRGLAFAGVSRIKDPAETVSVVDGSLHLASSGEQHFTLSFIRTSAAQIDSPLELNFFANSKLIKQSELIISQY